MTDAKTGERLEFDVDLAASPGFSIEIIRYRMAFNNVAEGWTWWPSADVAVDDYYRFKFLPLQSVDEKRSEYAFEDKIGFIAQVPASRASKVAKRATARLIKPVFSEGTAFWKATYGKPVDFTVKKRYLRGVLELISFIDGESGRLLKRLEPLAVKH